MSKRSLEDGLSWSAVSILCYSRGSTDDFGQHVIATYKPFARVRRHLYCVGSNSDRARQLHLSRPATDLLTESSAASHLKQA